jgi:hypothetical protein
MCSGSTFDKDIETAKSLGAEAYLVKPVRFDMLKSAIDAIPSLQLKPEDGGYSLLRRH